LAWTERYVRADAAGSGDGTTDTNSGANGAFTLAEAITHSATNTGIRYNVKGASGTFANAGTSRTFNGVGLTTAPNWWRGYNTVIGDLDNVADGAFPSITFTGTANMVASGAHQIFTSLNISGANTSGSQLSVSGGNIVIDRIRVENTGANALSVAIGVSGNGVRISNSWFKATSSATRVVNVNAGATELKGCTWEGGGIGLDIASTCVAYKSIARDNGSHGINLNSTNSMTIIDCTIYSAGGDGIRITTVPGPISAITNCEITDSSGYGINNNTGTNTNVVSRYGNTFYNNGSGPENGFGDSPSLNQLTESGAPFTNAASGDFSLVTASVSKTTGLPGKSENLGTTSYADRGAVQHPDPAGGSIAFPVARAI